MNLYAIFENFMKKRELTQKSSFCIILIKNHSNLYSSGLKIIIIASLLEVGVI